LKTGFEGNPAFIPDIKYSYVTFVAVSSERLSAGFFDLSLGHNRIFGLLISFDMLVIFGAYISPQSNA
jgi:hypothetical protein